MLLLVGIQMLGIMQLSGMQLSGLTCVWLNIISKMQESHYLNESIR